MDSALAVDLKLSRKLLRNLLPYPRNRQSVRNNFQLPDAKYPSKENTPRFLALFALLLSQLLGRVPKFYYGPPFDQQMALAPQDAFRTDPIENKGNLARESER